MCATSGGARPASLTAPTIVGFSSPWCVRPVGADACLGGNWILLRARGREIGAGLCRGGDMVVGRGVASGVSGGSSFSLVAVRVLFSGGQDRVICLGLIGLCSQSKSFEELKKLQG